MRTAMTLLTRTTTSLPRWAVSARRNRSRPVVDITEYGGLRAEEEGREAIDISPENPVRHGNTSSRSLSAEKWLYRYSKPMQGRQSVSAIIIIRLEKEGRSGIFIHERGGSAARL